MIPVDFGPESIFSSKDAANWRKSVDSFLLERRPTTGYEKIRINGQKQLMALHASKTKLQRLILINALIVLGHLGPRMTKY